MRQGKNKQQTKLVSPAAHGAGASGSAILFDKDKNK